MVVLEKLSLVCESQDAYRFFWWISNVIGALAIICRLVSRTNNAFALSNFTVAAAHPWPLLLGAC